MNTLYILDNATSYLLDEDKKKFGDFIMQLAKKKKKVRIIFVYTSLVNPDKWWKSSLETGFKINSDNYCREKINLSFSEPMAIKIIRSFARTHWNATISNNKKIKAEKIETYCINPWRDLVNDDNKEVSDEIKMVMNTPLGCVIMTSILLSDKKEEEQSLKEATKKLLLGIGGLSEKDINNFLIWLQKYKEQYSILEISYDFVDNDYSSSQPITAELVKDNKNIDERATISTEGKKTIL